MRPDSNARAASMSARGLGMLPMGSVGIATAEALRAALLLLASAHSPPTAILSQNGPETPVSPFRRNLLMNSYSYLAGAWKDWSALVGELMANYD
jgi:hypothetical protein